MLQKRATVTGMISLVPLVSRMWTMSTAPGLAYLPSIPLDVLAPRDQDGVQSLAIPDHHHRLPC